MINEDIINELCCDLIYSNQNCFNIDDDKDHMLYRLAYIDGMLDLKAKLITKLKEEKNVEQNS